MLEIKETSTGVSIQHYLKNKRISDIEIDREGNYWLSVINEGLFWSGDLTSKTWTKENSGLLSNQVTILDKYDNTIFIGNAKGELGVSTYPINNFKWFPTTIQKAFESLYPINKDHLLISNLGLFEFNLNNRTKNFIDLASIKSIEHVNENQLLIGTHAKSYLLNYNKNHFNIIDSLRNYRTNCTLFNPFANEFIIGYSDNLIIHKKQGSNWINNTITDKENNPILARNMTLTADSSIWIGTKKDGLQVIKNQTWVKNVFPKSNEILSINKVISKDSLVFAATNNGLWVLSTMSNFEIRFTKSKGLIDKEVNDILITPNNTILIASSKGLQEISIEKVIEKSKEPITYIQSISIQDKKISTQNPFIKMAYNQFPLEIRFGAISFKDNDRIQFKYRLKGLTTNWETASTEAPFVRYFSLPNKQFQFEVISINGDGIEDTQVTSLDIEIRPPFYFTIWFWLVILSIVLPIIFLLIKDRERRLLAFEKVKSDSESLTQQLRIAQLSAIKAQMNPHFIFNALNSIQNFIFKNDRVSANLYLGKFADLIRIILNQSNQFEITLREEIDALKLYLELEVVRFKDQLSYTIVSNSESNFDTITIPAMIIQPFVENSIKHGILHKKSSGIIQIRFNETNDTLVVEIEDNGIGRKKSKEIQSKRMDKHHSFSTIAIEKRIQLLNSTLPSPIKLEIFDLENDFGASLGTLVRLTFPIKK